jgi:DNA-binding transcriptional ArsR family regulator
MVNSSGLDRVFAALADPTRRHMVERLARGPMSVGEMAKGAGISQPGISKHVKVLERAGLIRRDVVGRVHCCRVEPRAMEAISDWLGEQRQFWNATLDRLDTYLSASNPKRKRTS